MQGTILLDYNENLKKIEEEEKSRFLKNLLEHFFENTDVAKQIETIWNIDGPLPPSQKIKIREILTTYGIQVIDDLDGHLTVHIDGELVAEWQKCNYKLKRDYKQIDPKKRIFLEMSINYWSVFEESNQSEQEIE